MNLKQLNDKLIAAARAHAPSDRVPYAFEQRIMARLGRQPASDTLTAWVQSFCRAALACAAVVMAVATLAVFLPDDSAPTTTSTTTVAATIELDQQLQDTLLAAVDSTDPVDLNEEIP